MFDNPTFFPTSPRLAARMIDKIVGHPGKVLEPSAGKGDLIESLIGREYHRLPDVSAIEIDPELQATLRGKRMKLIDTDFLTYSGPDKFDLIIANPPFDEGDKHLLKAIDILYRGQIIFLLNAETIRNPFTNSRKILARKLDELGAEIEFIKNGFVDAERKTDVEVALVNIIIDRQIEDDLFAGVDETRYQETHSISDKHEVSTGRTIAELVASYNETVQLGTETILAFYRNYRKIGKYLSLNDEGKNDHCYTSTDLTTKVQVQVNALLTSVRTAYWRQTLNLPEVSKRMTKKKGEEFEHAIAERCHMDFTENNIRQFVLNLIGGYEQTMIDAVLDIFDMFTDRHSWHRNNVNEKNIHYFNGWATNNAFKIGRKVIIPVYGGYDEGPFRGFSNNWQLQWKAKEMLRDIDIVCSYFDGGGRYVSISEALERSFSSSPHAPTQSGIESTYFKITVYKKGTIHLTFRDEDILRRFNVVACRGKGWLPQDYGVSPFSELTPEERNVAESFEGEPSYEENRSSPLFRVSGNSLGLEHKQAA